MNEESLERANAFLAFVAERTQPGGSLDASPAEIGRRVGIEQPLAAARAVRALLARRRLETEGSNYRLLDARPLEPGEPESVPRPPRRKPAGPSGSGRGGATAPTYSDVGRVAIERLIELGREVATLRAGARTAKSEARQARQSKDDAERLAQTLSARVQDLETKLEMAEQNMRTLLAAARGTGREEQVAPDVEMDAILGVLKGPA